MEPKLLKCTICKLPIDGVHIGTGDGTGQKFAHEVCYYKDKLDKAGTALTEISNILEILPQYSTSVDLNKLHQLNSILTRRSIGYTSALLDSNSCQEGAYYLFDSYNTAKKMGISSANTITLDTLHRLMGNNTPLLIDNSALLLIFRLFDQSIYALGQNNAQLRRETIQILNNYK